MGAKLKSPSKLCYYYIQKKNKSINKKKEGETFD